MKYLLNHDVMAIGLLIIFLTGILQVRYAFKEVEKGNVKIKIIFLIMGGITISLGLFLITIYMNKLIKY